MRYAVVNDLTTQNPVAGVKPADILRARKKRHFPRVDAAELPELLSAIDTYAGSEHTCLALQLMALTFVRTSEAHWRALVGVRLQGGTLEHSGRADEDEDTAHRAAKPAVARGSVQAARHFVWQRAGIPRAT